MELQKAVLYAAGLAEAGKPLDAESIAEHFTHIRPVVIDLRVGEPAPNTDPADFDRKQVRLDPATSHEVPGNPARVGRVPHFDVIYEVLGEGKRIEGYVLPVEGSGLWSTLYGFLALDADGTTIRGLTFYNHGETPGLGGEVDNPRW